MTIGKNLLTSNISFRCRHNMADFGPLTAAIGLPVWGTPANFNLFLMLASLLQRRRSVEANQTLHDLWSSLGLVHYIHFWGLLPLTEFCQVQVLEFCQVLVHWQRYCMALQQPASAKLCGVVQRMKLRNFRRGRHLYSAGRPSRWASALILVLPSLPLFLLRSA